MKKTRLTLAAPHGTPTSYITGFVMAVVLTIAAYFTVTRHAFPPTTIVTIIVGLAIAQLLVQLLFFLHMGQESKPRWNLVAFLFMLLVLLIVVVGSLWIMGNLNYNMTQGTPKQINQSITHDEGIQ